MAGAMRLFEHDDFRAILLQAAEDLDLPEQFVEKDYYVTEALRIAVATFGDDVVFKGGTSLSKGWDLIDRFSEDLDLFLIPGTRSKKAVDRDLRSLRDRIQDHPALEFDVAASQTFGGFGRDDYFSYATHFNAIPGLPTSIKVEIGIQSGDHPLEVRPISSLVSNSLRNRDLANIADDLEPFDMQFLHFRRTFIEKLFTIHGKIERLKSDGVPLARDTRHYADLYVLADQREVLDMLGTREDREIREDYDAKSREFFPKSYRPPEGLTFRESDAIFLTGDAHASVQSDYDIECERLFRHAPPAFDDVLKRLQDLASRL